MRKLIVGSQAQQAGVVTEYELRRGYVRMHRDVYVPKGYSPTLVDAIDGAWLRSGRRGVVGAASPQETRLRLLYLDAGFPRPTTQIAVFEDRWKVLRTLDMGWEEFMVAAEYDGDQHRTDRVQYVRDQRLMPKVARLGWDVIRAIKEDRDVEILDCTYLSLVRRGWNGQLLRPRRNRWWRPPMALRDAANL